jgi:hypothetical protein
MARKPKKVDDVWHNRRGLRVPVYLNYGSGQFTAGQFTAEVFGEKLTADKLEDIKEAIHKKFASFEAYQWQSVIYISQRSHAGKDHFSRNRESLAAGIDIEFWRVEIAQNPQSEKFFVERPFLNAEGLTDEQVKTLATHRGASYEEAERAHYIERNAQERKSGHDVKTHTFYESDTRIPYSPAAWETLCLIRQRIVDAGQQLAEFTEQPDLAKRLEDIGSRFKLLPAMTGSKS